MLHAVAYRAFFFQELFAYMKFAGCSGIIRLFVHMVLMCVNHVLPCNKTEQQRPGANGMADVSFHSNRLSRSKTNDY